MKLSVVICTHNPRKEFLDKVLDALKVQTLDKSHWELIIVDNFSTPTVSSAFDVSWHPNARFVREDALGSAYARVRGVHESGAEYILFVDDDNCLSPDYLAVAQHEMDLNPLLAALGAGKILPEYEKQPTAEALDYVLNLALRDEPRSHYSNEISLNRATPYSAGMIIRRSIALDYVASFKKRRFAEVLGRTGKSVLLSGEDVDMALHACKRQFLVGVTPNLKMLHLIPETRLVNDYLVRIAAGHAYSKYILGRMWGYEQDYKENGLLKQLRYWKRRFKTKGLAREVFIAEQRAIRDARRDWLNISAS